MEAKIYRFQGPDSVPPVFNHSGSKKGTTGEAGDGARADGRSPLDIRQVFLKTGIITGAKGSAYIECGNTRVICSVHGPRQLASSMDFSDTGSLLCDVRFAAFAKGPEATHKRRDDVLMEEKQLGAFLHRSLVSSIRLESFPKALVEVYVNILECDGSELTSAITCATAALVDAGVELTDLTVGCTLAISKGSSSSILMDPSKAEIKHAAGVLEVAMQCNHSETITHFVQNGSFEQSESMIRLAIDGCMKMHRQILRPSLQ